MTLALGTQTGSMTNHLLSRATIGQPEPVVGMGATILCWTDRHAATIVKVETARGRTLLTVREDKATVICGSTHDGSAQYRFEPNPHGREYVYRQHKSGTWQQVMLNKATGRWVKTEGEGLRIGHRAAYRDPCF